MRQVRVELRLAREHRRQVEHVSRCVPGDEIGEHVRFQDARRDGLHALLADRLVELDEIQRDDTDSLLAQRRDQ